MKTLLLLILASSLNFSSQQTTNEVYFCDSKGGKKYHFTKDCRGLSNCKHKIEKIKLTDAKNKGLTLCGFED